MSGSDVALLVARFTRSIVRVHRFASGPGLPLNLSLNLSKHYFGSPDSSLNR